MPFGWILIVGAGCKTCARWQRRIAGAQNRFRFSSQVADNYRLMPHTGTGGPSMPQRASIFRSGIRKSARSIPTVNTPTPSRPWAHCSVFPRRIGLYRLAELSVFSTCDLRNPIGSELTCIEACQRIKASGRKLDLEIPNALRRRQKCPRFKMSALCPVRTQRVPTPLPL
jgi:hypothetical protein